MQMANQKNYNVNDVVDYAEKIVQRLFETRNWCSAEQLLRECPDEMRADVAFVLLQHVVIDPFGGDYRGGFH